MGNSKIAISSPESVLRTFVKRGARYHIEKRPSAVIIIVLKGKIEFTFDDTLIVCNKNRSVFIPEGEKYSHVCVEDAESLLFNFKTENDNLKPFGIDGIDKIMAESIFSELEEAFSGFNFEYRIISLYYAFFSQVFEKKNNFDKSENYVEQAEKVIIENFGRNDFSCDEVASKINISAVYLRKLFQKYRGISPSEYILKMRMKKARIYLLQGYSCSECAHNVGYSDVYQFSRAYKKYYGYSPSSTWNLI